MPRRPEDSIKISEPFRKRIAALIADEETENGKPCTSALFAERVGIGKTTVSNAALFGIVPTTRALIKIADALELSFSYLLGSTEKNEFIPSAAPSSFAARLEELRKERKITYGAIAQSMPFPRTYFYEWRKDNTLPSPEYLLAIASFFAVSPDYLLGRTDYKN